MTRSSASRPWLQTRPNVYEAFDQLDGSHPWQKAVPAGCVLYPVRKLDRGSVIYFNFPLAKEMGLISENHPSSMDAQLEAKILETFNLRIVNEFDQERPKLPESWQIKSKPYMATRYLQLQHSSKRGQTSGDGRSIWNGVVRHAGKVWDVSSRGTGVTRFAPGSVKANKNLATGNEQFGYSCGLAELDELIVSAIQSEIFHNQGIATERVLCVIDQGNGCGIGVRAGENLLRPAHLFLYLKQSRWSELKAATDYFIQRQVENGKYPLRLNDSQKYNYLAKRICRDFARFVGRIEAENIFLWIDWDGDNLLMDPGIIDYGSIRQFGLHHASYRYDDVERFSTNLLEQKYKALQVMKTILQMVDFLSQSASNAVRKVLKDFNQHPLLGEFVSEFRAARLRHKLSLAGFAPEDILLLEAHPRLLKSWEKACLTLERKRVPGSPKKVADGVLSPALFDVKMLLRSLPEHFLKHGSWELPSFSWCLEKMKTPYSRRRDFTRNLTLRSNLTELVSAHARMLKILRSKGAGKIQTQRHTPVLTGNALIYAIGEINESAKKAPKDQRVQNLIELLIQHFAPGTNFHSLPREIKDPQAWQQILNIIESHKYSI